MPWKGYETEFGDILPQTPAGVCLSGCCAVVNLILIILFFPCTVIQLGQFQYGLVRNTVTGYVDLETSYVPGWYWIGFWQDFVEFPSTLNTIEFSREKPEEGVQHLSVLTSRDRDGKQISMDISIQYILRTENLGKIYKDMLTQYEDIYISELRDALAKAANNFPIQDAWLNYTSIVDIMRARCQEVLESRYSECWGFQVWGVTLTTKYEAKLLLTHVRKQATMNEMAKKVQAEYRASTQVLLSEYRKNVTIIKSGGNAEKYNLEREAYAYAQANIISAQAKAIQIVKDRVCPDYALITEPSGSTRCVGAKWSMTSTQLVGYQKMVLLKSHNASQIIYNMKGGSNPQAMNIAASRNIMQGRARRRLLLKEMEGEPDEDVGYEGKEVDESQEEGPEL